jgi:guanylate kinase
MLYALCGVSGVGKTTLQHVLLQRQPTLRRFVTSTTRAPRPGEIDHLDYHFLSVQQFESAVQTGRIVCPIQYREAWYGTAREDLEACAQKEMLAVLRPDKITELQRFTTLIGIYILKAEQDQPVSPDDQIILAHRHLCLHLVTNMPGDLDTAVTEILALIHTYSGGSLV